MHKLIVIFFTSLLGLCTAVHASQLVVGTNAEFAPFSFIEDGVIVGFDIDIAKEVGNRLGADLTFKDMPFEAVIPDVIMGNVHFVAAGISYTDERAKVVLFTKPYLNGDPLVILTLAGSGAEGISDINSLKGKQVVVNEGFTADLLLSEQSGFSLIRLPATADAFLALTSRRADAFVTARSTVDQFFQSQDPKKFHAVPIEGTAETCALVVSKKHPELLTKIQKALDEMEIDGTIAALKTKWKLP